MAIPAEAITQNITHISKMDSPNPFFLHHGDNTGAMIVSKPLNGDNYNSWKKPMIMALSAKNKLSFVNGTLPLILLVWHGLAVMTWFSYGC